MIVASNMQDSGKREEFETGAVRDAAGGKIRYDLISPLFVLTVLKQFGRDRVITGCCHIDSVAEYVARFRETRRMKYLGRAAIAMASIMDGTGEKCAFQTEAWDRLAEWLMEGTRKYTDRNWEQGIPMERTVQSLLRHLRGCHDSADSEDHGAAVLCNLMFLCHTSKMIRRGLLPAELDDMPVYTMEE